tara:strand:- start:139 stop:471 length:333 start_codon:yes stop_codon:yes gene_type:complete
MSSTARACDASVSFTITLPPPTFGPDGAVLAAGLDRDDEEVALRRRTGCGGGVKPVSSRLAGSRSRLPSDELLVAVFAWATGGDSSPPQSTNNSSMTATEQKANMPNTMA